MRKKVCSCCLSLIMVTTVFGCGSSNLENVVNDEVAEVYESEKNASNDEVYVVEEIKSEEESDEAEITSEETEEIVDEDVATTQTSGFVMTNALDGNVSKEDFKINLNGNEVQMGIDINTLIPSIGEPDIFSSARSCIDDGEEKQYVYGGYTIYTYPNQNQDIIYLIEFDENAVTDANIGIGSTKEDVEKAYGQEYSTMGDYILYNYGDLSCISFQYTDGVVTYLDMYYKE